MNQPGNQQYPGQGQTLIQAGPPGQAQPQYVAASPQYVAAPPPGVAVQLPGYGQVAQQPQMQAAAPVAQLQVQVPVPAKPAGSANGDQLLAGAGRTVYEFKGAHSEEARSGGKHQTFFANAGDLAATPIHEERHTNLRTSGTSILVGGIGVVAIAGLLAFFLMSEGAKNASGEPAAEPEVAAAPAPVAAPEPTPVADPAAVPAEGTPVPPVDPAATPEGATGGVVEPPKPAEDAAPTPEPAPEPKPEPAPEPAKKKSTSTKKKTTPAPAPTPEKKKKVSPISPSKPPRDGLNNLPAPD